ncbi:MAG TPA: HlyD family type I secretion periplasmic adaptor subunit [Geminicoccaceae bacterium]|nr:HlyD family type I secretion periplasmic adaptor subunit [Geminicoccaceae bacterium]
MRLVDLEADFLPDARALIDRQASPLASLLLAAIAALLVAAFAWMAWAEVEEVVRAGGQVEPAGRVKVINHPRGGRVALVHVRDGQRVAPGDLLVTFDAEVREGEHAEFLGRWQARAAEAARLEAEATGAPMALEPELAAARPDLAGAQALLLQARAEALAAQRDALERQSQTRKAELAATAAELQRIRSGLALLEEQLASVSELAELGLYPRLKLVAVQRQVSDARGELARTRAEIASSEAALAEAQSRLAALDTAWHKDVLSELAAATVDRDRLKEQLATQRALLTGLAVRAPVAGIVEELQVAAPGQAFGPNDPLMKLVPADEGMVVEARVRNEDIGRLRVGMPATVKVRAYDYLRFGSLAGRVLKIATDATPEPRTGVLGYVVTVATERDRLGAAPGEREIVPGMVVDVELKVGERTILSYLTDRILQLRDGAFRDG